MEQRRLSEGKLDLGPVEDVKHNDVVAAVPEVLQPGQHRGHVVEQVAQDQHQPATFEPLGQIVKDRPAARFLLGLAILHDVQQLVEMRRIAAGANQRADFVVERRQPDAVLLLQNQVRQRGSHALCVFQLRQRRGVAAVAHAFAGIQKQVADEVRFLLVLLEVELVGLAIHLPVDKAQVVAGAVFAVFGKLDREAVVGTAMRAGDIAFDDRAGAQFQPMQLRQRLRI